MRRMITALAVVLVLLSGCGGSGTTTSGNDPDVPVPSAVPLPSLPGQDPLQRARELWEKAKQTAEKVTATRTFTIKTVDVAGQSVKGKDGVTYRIDHGMPTPDGWLSSADILGKLKKGRTLTVRSSEVLDETQRTVWSITDW